MLAFCVLAILSSNSWASDGAGLIYLHNRLYDPEIGRFISPDPIIPGAGNIALNKYAYVDNAPSSYTDIDGLMKGGRRKGESSKRKHPKPPKYLTLINDVTYALGIDRPRLEWMLQNQGLADAKVTGQFCKLSNAIQNCLLAEIKLRKEQAKGREASLDKIAKLNRELNNNLDGLQRTIKKGNKIVEKGGWLNKRDWESVVGPPISGVNIPSGEPVETVTKVEPPIKGPIYEGPIQTPAEKPIVDLPKVDPLPLDTMHGPADSFIGTLQSPLVGSPKGIFHPGVNWSIDWLAIGGTTVTAGTVLAAVMAAGSGGGSGPVPVFMHFPRRYKMY